MRDSCDGAALLESITRDIKGHLFRILVRKGTIFTKIYQAVTLHTTQYISMFLGPQRWPRFVLACCAQKLLEPEVVCIYAPNLHRCRSWRNLICFIVYYCLQHFRTTSSKIVSQKHDTRKVKSGSQHEEMATSICSIWSVPLNNA